MYTCYNVELEYMIIPRLLFAAFQLLVYWKVDHNTVVHLHSLNPITNAIECTCLTTLYFLA